MEIQQVARLARQASFQMAALQSAVKDKALAAISEALKNRSQEIIAANTKDMAEAEKTGLAAPLLKRLGFGEAKIDEVCKGLTSLIAIPDPVGKTLSALELDDKLELFKVSRPIGVIGVIFESRPDALVQISSLCLKSGNAVLLKGGSEAAHTNRILAEVITTAGRQAGLPDGWLGLLETRSDVSDMLALDEDIDLIIPRGSNAFVKHIMDNTHIPVLGHADGICHVYIDESADPDMAVNIAVDSKTQYVAVCNAAETLLIHENAAPALLPRLKTALEGKGVEIRGCERARSFIDVAQAVEGIGLPNIWT